MRAVLAAWNFHRIFKFDIWGVLFWVNVVAILTIVIALVISHRRDRVERSPANLTPFYDDDTLEGVHLERVLGWALFFFAIFAVTLPLYWLAEGRRETASVKYFDENSVKRGATLFANSGEAFDPAKSLKCADCHGPAGVGGSGAPYLYRDPATAKAYKLTWRAPALNTVLYRFSPQEVHDIITYGRQGTPMAAWGVVGGGPKNEQSINDLVAYLTSIQLPPGDAKTAAADLQHCDKPTTALGQTACALQTAKQQADTQLTDANKSLSDANAQLKTDQDALNADQDPNTTGTQTCTDVSNSKDATLGDARVKCRDLSDATTSPDGADYKAISDAKDAVAWAEEWKKRRADVTNGQLLFENSCARCHTKNWSIFDPSKGATEGLRPENMLGLPGGGGSLGFNLRDNEMQRRFPDSFDTSNQLVAGSGILDHFAFVRNGSEYQQKYGSGGIGSGRMPGQCNDSLDPKVIVKYRGCMLTGGVYKTGDTIQLGDSAATIDEHMIEEIVLYERCGLNDTGSSLAPPKADYTTNCK